MLCNIILFHLNHYPKSKDKCQSFFNWLIGCYKWLYFLVNTKYKCFAEALDCTMLKLRKNIAVPQMSIWKQNKALGTYCVSAYICRTKQWSFFFWYYYIYGIEKTIYYGSKRATTKERELTCLLKMTFYILEFQRFLKNIIVKEQYIFYFVYLSMKSSL